MPAKKPNFSWDDTFDCRVFGVRNFDFIKAQSIITHAGVKKTTALIQSASEALAEDGLMLVSYRKGPADTQPPERDWTYPTNVPYPESWLENLAEESGLVWRELNWHHPGATWAALARDERHLPPVDAPLGLQGLSEPRWKRPREASDDPVSR